MSHRTSAVVVLDSITPYGEATRLTSMYVVYHIPGKKVGCTNNFEVRKKQYPRRNGV
jgi:hypothetical protein